MWKDWSIFSWNQPYLYSVIYCIYMYMYLKWYMVPGTCTTGVHYPRYYLLLYKILYTGTRVLVPGTGVHLYWYWYWYCTGTGTTYSTTLYYLHVYSVQYWYW